MAQRLLMQANPAFAQLIDPDFLSKHVSGLNKSRRNNRTAVKLTAMSQFHTLRKNLNF